MKELNTQHITNLVLRARQNDSNAFAELYAMTYNKVYNYARHYLRDNYLAQDATQEIYILVLKNLSKLNDPTLFIAWLNRISFNVCFDMQKKLKTFDCQTFEPEFLEILEDNHPYSNPEEVFRKNDECQHLMEALEHLPFQERQVIVMR
ncbi:MAG: RNA polymerase sigma factor, partial [Lachnospiraceae bacterium]|nr:RNA polymerase sigma factor [Lachnospiraceae bacterium]